MSKYEKVKKAFNDYVSLEVPSGVKVSGAEILFVDEVAEKNFEDFFHEKSKRWDKYVGLRDSLIGAKYDA